LTTKYEIKKVTDWKDKRFSFFLPTRKRNKWNDCKLAHLLVAAFGGWASPTTSK
jgi:hypothetical protein